MPADHSLTYTQFSIKNIPHTLRLQKLISNISRIIASNNCESICDVGCSNGYITSLIQKKFPKCKIVGLDYDFENIKIAQEKYPEIDFDLINLNNNFTYNKKFDLVYCLETLEHVGDIKSAIINLKNICTESGTIMISVPIEHGPIGVIKYVLKVVLYNYSPEEINASRLDYFKALFSRGRISRMRPRREGFGTHFGFDYRDVDDVLVSMNLNFRAKNFFTTRVYTVNMSQSSF